MTMQTQMQAARAASVCPTGNLIGNTASASFTGSIDNGTPGQAGTTLHVSGVTGTIQVGDMFSGAAPGGGTNPPPFGVIVSGSGSTWTVSMAEAVSAQAMASYTPLVYPLTAIVAMGAADSGNSGCTVTWQSAASQYAALSAGAAIGSWSLCTTNDAVCGIGGTGSNGVYKATATGLTPSRELFVNNVRYIRPHGAAYPAGVFTLNSTTITDASGTVSGYTHDLTHVEIDIQTSFTESDCYVASATGTTITPQANCYQNFKNTVITSAVVYQVSNAYELLTAANCSGGGCFYWDQSVTPNVVYVLPRTGVSMTSPAVYAPQLPQVLTGNAAAYLKFSRLVFEHAAMETYDNATGFTTAFINGICPGSGCNESHPYTFYDSMPAAIEFSNNSDNITFDHSALVRNAGRGLWPQHTSATFTVTNNLLSDNGAGGFQYGDYYDPSAVSNQTTGLTYENNLQDAAKQYFTMGEVTAPYFTSSLLQQNTLYDDNAGFQAIVFHFNLDTGSYSASDTITNNAVNWFCQAAGNALMDCGAYHPAGSTGLTATGNYFFHGDGGNCLYLDNGTSNDTASGNVCDTFTGNFVSINGGTGNTEANNCTTNTTTLITGGNAPTGTVSFTSGSAPATPPPTPTCAAVIAAAGVQAGHTPGP